MMMDIAYKAEQVRSQKLFEASVEFLSLYVKLSSQIGIIELQRALEFPPNGSLREKLLQRVLLEIPDEM